MQTLINLISNVFLFLLIIEVVRFILFKLFIRNPIIRFFFTKTSGNKYYFKKRLKHYRKWIKKIRKTYNKLVLNIENKQHNKYQETKKKVVNYNNVIDYKKNKKLRYKWNK